MKDLEIFIMKSLNLQEGDIVVMQMPFEDARESDFFPLNNKSKSFKPGHVAVWVAGDKPTAHSIREGYRLPGLRLTSVNDGIAMVYRFKNKELAAIAAKIIKTWALASSQLNLKSYLERYPAKDWPDRHQKDINNFFTADTNFVTAPATPYLESRASADLRDLHFDKTKTVLTREGMQRAIKFSARREMANEGMSKGQRCTPVVVAAYQAALLAEIVKALSKQDSKQMKLKDFDEYSKVMFKEGWEKTDLGKRLLEAVKKNDFSAFFPKALNVDQRFVTPATLFAGLSGDENFEYVGRFSVFQDRAEVVDKEGCLHSYSTLKYSPK